jgi:thiol-disulfide isomerase/thioredoxin
MAALTVGAKAPEFELKTLVGKQFSLGGELAGGPVVLAFFKVSCPTCQYALPFFERLHKAYRRQGRHMLGDFAEQCQRDCGVQQGIWRYVPCLLDDTNAYPVSNAYGLTNVPTIFWIAQDGEIEVSSVGWVKADFEEISRGMAEVGKLAPATVFKPGEDVRDFRAG